MAEKITEKKKVNPVKKTIVKKPVAKKETTPEESEVKEFVFCENCGAKCLKEADFCKECGKLFKNEETKDSNRDNDKLMAVLAYILAPVPYFARKDNAEIQYHARQGMNLFCLGVIWSIISIILTFAIKFKKPCFTYWTSSYMCSYTPWWISLIAWLGSLAITALAVIGIINVCTGKKKRLPLIGKIEIFK